MSLEIEHKYLVKDKSYRELAVSCSEIRQGYLCRDAEHTVRIRVRDGHGYLTVKGLTTGAVRREYEYEISKSDAEEMLQMCSGPILYKRRYIVVYDGMKWEIDEFLGNREGLVMAEIELPDEEKKYRIPPFVGENVTGDPAYYNSNL